MADSTQTSSETPNQPAAPEAKPAAVAPTSAESAPKPNESKTPPAADPAAKPAESAKPAEAVKPAAATDPAKPATPVAPALPDTYTITPPEGLQIDPGMLPAMAPAFKAAGLSQENVQALASTFLEWQRGAPERILARDLAVTMKDPEIGGLNYGRTQGYVNQALSAFTDPEFRSFLQQAGIANRLEFVRVFERIGRAMSGDTPARGSPTSAGEMSMADRLYSRSKKVNS